jgi:hypothetical protein
MTESDPEIDSARNRTTAIVSHLYYFTTLEEGCEVWGMGRMGIIWRQ